MCICKYYQDCYWGHQNIFTCSDVDIIRRLKLKRNPRSSIGKHRCNPLFSLRRTGVGRVVTSASSYDIFGSGRNESYGSAAKQIPELKDRFHVHMLVMYVCWFPYPVNCVCISTSIATSVRNIDTMSRPTGTRSACNVFPIQTMGTIYVYHCLSNTTFGT